MATWKIHHDLRVTYTHPRVQEGAVQECGKPTNPEVCKFGDVLAWAAREGDGGDVIHTSKGLFFVQSRASA